MQGPGFFSDRLHARPCGLRTGRTRTGREAAQAISGLARFLHREGHASSNRHPDPPPDREPFLGAGLAHEGDRRSLPGGLRHLGSRLAPRPPRSSPRATGFASPATSASGAGRPLVGPPSRSASTTTGSTSCTTSPRSLPRPVSWTPWTGPRDGARILLAATACSPPTGSTATRWSSGSTTGDAHPNLPWERLTTRGIALDPPAGALPPQHHDRAPRRCSRALRPRDRLRGVPRGKLYRFRFQVAEIVDTLRSTSPFGEYWSYLNIHIVEAPSAEAGLRATRREPPSARISPRATRSPRVTGAGSGPSRAWLREPTPSCSSPTPGFARSPTTATAS